MFGEPPIWSPFSVEVPYIHDGLLPIYFSSLDQVPVILILLSTYFHPHSIHKAHPVRLTCGLLEGEGVISLFCV